MKRFFAYLTSGIVGGLVVFAGISLSNEPLKTVQPAENSASTQIHRVSNPFVVSDGTELLNTDFTLAAEKTVESVVHVKNSVISRAPVTLEDIFFGRVREREMVGTGSGVIISPDGYIITNNHVINNANKLEVTLNDNSIYEAEIIGTDPEADIALIKIKPDKELPFATFGDSDAVKLGEWVLAVGNPYNLNATVTAGIVSAKSREIERANMAVPYIQTDAAINSGNSGGALVNVKGELIGINTMIQSQNGSFIGYAFAVPSNNARKIVEDLMEYGNVQRGILGIRGSTLNSKIASELNLNLTEGVYVGGISSNTGADMSQLKEGDIIVGVDYIEVKKFSDLVGYVNTKRPGDEVVLKVHRNNRYMDIPVELIKIVDIDELNIRVRDLKPADFKKLKIEYGIKVESMMGRTNYNLTDYIILKINDQEVKSVDQFKRLVKEYQNSSNSLELLTPNGERVTVLTR